MAEVVVSVQRFAAADLPHLCARTARPTEEVLRFSVANGPISLAGWLPLSRAGRAQVRLAGVGSLVAVAVAAAAWLLYLLRPGGASGAVAFVAGAVAAGSLWARVRLRIAGWLEDDGVTVRLTNVHPRFAAAVTRTNHASVQRPPVGDTRPPAGGQ